MNQPSKLPEPPSPSPLQPRYLIAMSYEEMVDLWPALSAGYYAMQMATPVTTVPKERCVKAWEVLCTRMADVMYPPRRTGASAGGLDVAKERV